MFMVCQFWNLLPLHLNREDTLNSMIKPLETLSESDVHDVQFFLNMSISVYFNLSLCFFLHLLSLVFVF